MIHQAKRCLIIPDVHQDIAWVERIFAQETDYDLVVFSGDYFDSSLAPKFRAGVEKTCTYLDAKRRELGPKCVFLLGNHDIQYLEAKSACDHCRTPRNLHYKCGSSYRHSAAAKIAKGLSAEFWANARLFVYVNDRLISHAGVHPSLWPQRPTIADSLNALDAGCKTALQQINLAENPLLLPGQARGGDAPVGGITWQDWDDEFQDALPCPQIVGHTSNPVGARQKQRSWCIDGRQSCYGILTHEGLRVNRC